MLLSPPRQQMGTEPTIVRMVRGKWQYVLKYKTSQLRQVQVSRAGFQCPVSAESVQSGLSLKNHICLLSEAAILGKSKKSECLMILLTSGSCAVLVWLCWQVLLLTFFCTEALTPPQGEEKDQKKTQAELNEPLLLFLTIRLPLSLGIC